jgi:hypothetical protein
MFDNRFSRRCFFYGAALAGAIPRGGFGSTPSLKAAGYKSPNEKLNLAAIGAGGQLRKRGGAGGWIKPIFRKGWEPKLT